MEDVAEWERKVLWGRERERAVLKSRGILKGGEVAKSYHYWHQLLILTSPPIAHQHCNLLHVVPVGSPIGTLFVVRHVDVELISLLVGEDVKEVITNPELRLHVPKACFVFIPVSVEIHLPPGRCRLVNAALSIILFTF